MKIFKILLICLTTLMLYSPVSIKFIGLNAAVNPLSYPSILSSKDINYRSNKPAKNISVNEISVIESKNIEDFTIFEPTLDISFSGRFRVGETFFELSVFNSKSINISDFIETKFPASKFNEDHTFELNEVNSNSFSKVVTKIRGKYYFYYLKKVHEKFWTLGFEMNKFRSEDLKNIVSAIKINNLVLDGILVDEDLRKYIDKVNDFNKEKNNRSTLMNIINFSPLKLLADASTYYLPWKAGDSYSIEQDWGANDNPCIGTCSHLGLSGYAYDFGLPEGVDVLASKGGIVTYVKGNETTCGGTAYLDKANYVVINHEDGKSTNYYHLQSTTVSVGDTVVGGQIIGKSGKTGFTSTNGTETSCAAHLHFQKQAQGGQYTQSEAFYFAEYPNATPNGELQYGSIVTSQNTLSLSSSNFCSGQSVMVFSNYRNNLNCGVSNLIYLSPNAKITGESRLYIN